MAPPKKSAPSSLYDSFLMLSALVLGIILRVMYTLSTTYLERGHDAQGHIDHILYMADHFRIPPAIEGWEFYQPPHYYFINALWVLLARTSSFSETAILEGVQTLSFMMSIATLMVLLWIGRLIFDPVKQRIEHALFCFFFAVFPGLVFMAPRINNDLLYTLYGFAFVGFLLHWWKTQKIDYWYFAIAIGGIGIITKTNAILFPIIAFACLFFAKKIPMREKIRVGIASSVMLLVMAGWYPAYRFFVDTRTREAVEITDNAAAYVTPTLTNLNSNLIVENTWKNFVIFNPLQILIHPYNNPWIDDARRMYFWEYVFRSAFLGEFDHGPLLIYVAQQMLAFGLAMLGMSLFGLYRSVVTRDPYLLPMIFIFAVTAAAHMAFRFLAPYSAHQDYRYSPLIILPLIYFAVVSIQSFPTFLRPIAAGLLTIFIFTMTAFMAGFLLLNI